MTIVDHAVRLPEDLAINILNAAATFSFDMIEAVDGYYRRHLMMAVEQGNVSRQKEILNELIPVLERHAGSRHNQAARDKDIIEQIQVIESGLVSGDPTEWTRARADEFRTPVIDIAEMLKIAKEKWTKDLEAEMLTQGRTFTEAQKDSSMEVKRTRSGAIHVTDFDEDIEL